MASNAEVPQPPSEDVANLQLDEVTGERVSKSECAFKLHDRSIALLMLLNLDKRRNKQREKAAKNAEKASSSPAAPGATKAKTGNPEDDEGKLDPRQYFELRSRAVKKMLETKEPNPYPHKFHATTDLKQFVKEYEGLKTGEGRRASG